MATDTTEERVYRLGVKKINLASRIGDEQEVNRVFTKQQLDALTSEEVSEALSITELLKVDSVAAYTQIAHDGLTVHDHAEVLNAQSKVQVSDKAMCEARNYH